MASTILPYTIDPGEDLDANEVQGNFDALATNVGTISSKVNTLQSSVSSSLATVTSNVDAKISTLLSTLYPVGSIYITTSTSDTCPLASLITGSTWELVASGKALWTGTTSNANTTIAAGLPNITGTVETYGGGQAGAFYQGDWIKGGWDGDGGRYYSHFNASRCSSIYGKSSTVQPPAYVIIAYRRTA